MEFIEPTESATFTLDPAEAAEVRKSIASSRSSWWITALGLGFGTATGVLRLVSHGLHDIMGWIFVGAYLLLIGTALASRYLRFPIESHPAKLLVDSRGVQVVQNSRATRAVKYAAISRVRILPNVIIIEVRWAPAIITTRRALPNSGAQLIQIFENRLVGKRMLQRQSGSSVIVNTSSA